MTSPHTIRCHTLRESERALPPGRWVQRKGVQHFEPDQPPLIFIDEPSAWPTIQLCPVCDTTHEADLQCPACREWAQRAEELWSWERQRFANRHIVWDILDARKSVSA